MGFPSDSVVKNPPVNGGDMGLIHVWRRKWHPTPIFLPGKYHGQRSWWSRVHGVAKDSDMKLATKLLQNQYYIFKSSYSTIIKALVKKRTCGQLGI